MSYDLAVFEPRAELRNRAEFLTWFTDRTSWKGRRDYSDPGNAALDLQAWYREMIQAFPPLNGPDRPENMDLCAADYSIGPDIIYVAFSRGRAADAYETMFRLASRHGVGIFNAGGNAEAWFPGPNGQLELIHQHQEGDPPGRMSRIIEEAIARHGALHVNTIQDALAEIASDPHGVKPIVLRQMGMIKVVPDLEGMYQKEMMVGLSSWIIADGNYPHFKRGQRTSFALAFYLADFPLDIPGDWLSINPPGADQTSISHIQIRKAARWRRAGLLGEWQALRQH